MERTWRDVYLEEVDRQVGVLRDARRRGQTRLTIAGRDRDPSRMTDRTIREIAERETERLVNYAINVELEQKRRRAA